MRVKKLLKKLSCLAMVSKVFMFINHTTEVHTCVQQPVSIKTEAVAVFRHQRLEGEGCALK